MKKVLYLFILFIFLIPVNIDAIDIKSKNAVMYNLNDDEVIFEFNSHEKVYIASMTKIMTCIVALEKIDNLDDAVVMTQPMFYHLAEDNASVAGFKVGEKVTYRDLLYGLMLPSGADAAQALAISTYGSIDKFVEAMNFKATEIHLENTHFVNTTGIDDPNHYSTVSDVAFLLKYSLGNKDFKEIFEADKYTTSNKLHTFVATRNKYNMDTSFIDGSKTGFTYDAGLCLASTSHYNDVNLLLVTANAPYNNKLNHLIDAKNIYEYFFNNYSYRDIANIGDKITDYTLDDGRTINYYVDENIKRYMINNCELKKEYIEKDNKEYNNILGTYYIKCNDEILYKRDIILNVTHNEKNNNIQIIIISILFIFVVLFGILLFIIKRRKKREIFKKRRNKKRIKG